jgi:hypothetical protein
MRIYMSAAALLAGLVTLGTANAGNLYDHEGTTLGLNVDAMAGIFSTTEDYLAEGGKTWSEAYLHGVLVGTTRAGKGEFYGGLGAIAQGTWGDGDAGGYTTGRERDADLEDAYVGWRSSDGLVDFSIGRQQFQLGDGFLISNDPVSLGKGLDAPGVDVDRGGAYYLAGKKSFHNTAVLRLDPEGPLRGDVFWLKSDNPYQQDTELGGLNVEYVSETHGTLGLSWMKVLDVDRGGGLGIFDQREGMRVTSVRGQGSMGVENLFLSFEYVDQRGGDTAVKNEANAWTVEGGWTFADSPWTPTLNYRHARFSADKVSTTRNEAFDPLFFGLSRGLGTWFQGEVASNYAGPANSGNKVDRLELTLLPREDLSVSLQYWDIKSIGNAPDLDGREIDLFAVWEINKNFTLLPLLGIYEPRGADVKALQGNNRRNVYMQAVLIYNY